MEQMSLESKLAGTIMVLSGLRVEGNEEYQKTIADTIVKNKLNNSIIALIKAYRNQPAERFIAKSLFRELSNEVSESIDNLCAVGCNADVLSLLNKTVLYGEYGTTNFFSYLSKAHNAAAKNKTAKDETPDVLSSIARSLNQDSVFRALAKFDEVNKTKEDALYAKTDRSYVDFIGLTAFHTKGNYEDVNNAAELIFKYEDLRTMSTIHDFLSFRFKHEMRIDLSLSMGVFNDERVAYAIKAYGDREGLHRIDLPINAFGGISHACSTDKCFEYSHKLARIMIEGALTNLPEFLKKAYMSRASMEIIDNEYKRLFIESFE